jgi:hypothetical protein
MVDCSPGRSAASPRCVRASSSSRSLGSDADRRLRPDRPPRRLIVPLHRRTMVLDILKGVPSRLGAGSSRDGRTARTSGLRLRMDNAATDSARSSKAVARAAARRKPGETAETEYSRQPQKSHHLDDAQNRSSHLKG